MTCRMNPQLDVVDCPSMRRPKWQDVVPGLQERRSASGECAAFTYVALEQQANSCKVIFLCFGEESNIPKLQLCKMFFVNFRWVIT